MAADTTVTEDDVGKRVVNSSGEVIGRVIDIKSGGAHVDPNPGSNDSFENKPAREHDTNNRIYRSKSEEIDSITDDEVRIRT